MGKEKVTDIENVLHELNILKKRCAYYEKKFLKMSKIIRDATYRGINQASENHYLRQQLGQRSHKVMEA